MARQESCLHYRRVDRPGRTVAPLTDRHLCTQTRPHLLQEAWLRLPGWVGSFPRVPPPWVSSSELCCYQPSHAHLYPWIKDRALCVSLPAMGRPACTWHCTDLAAAGELSAAPNLERPGGSKSFGTGQASPHVARAFCGVLNYLLVGFASSGY